MTKPFEEQFTAWIDGVLAGDELAAFERDLAVRPDADSLRREKRAAGQLRHLLREHLPAAVPALGNNADFFNHQLRERLQAETRRDELAAAARPRSWWWLRGRDRSDSATTGGGTLAPARLLAAGAAFLLVAGLGIYALIPEPSGAGSSAGGPVATVETPASPDSSKLPAVNATAPIVPAAASPSETAVAAATSATPAAPAGTAESRTEVAILEPAQRGPGYSEITDARVPEGTATSVTPMHFGDQNADVLWLDGLDYLSASEFEGPPPAATTAAPSTPAAGQP